MGSNETEEFNTGLERPGAAFLTGWATAGPSGGGLCNVHLTDAMLSLTCILLIAFECPTAQRSKSFASQPVLVCSDR